MSGTRLLAIILLVGGILAIVYGGFSFNRSKGEADLGPVSLEVKEKERVNIPMWAGVVAVVLGGVMLMAPRRNV
ncbi:MAG TPA: hypothetical protein VM764_10365 [Gemmatimonadaceae bacterium]|nr:hypothetical protein [Gemmatimonadaceae bacterium]